MMLYGLGIVGGDYGATKIAKPMEQTRLHPLEALQNIGRPLVTGFALLLLLVSGWGLVNLFGYWGRSVELVKGAAGEIREERIDKQVRYLVPFTVDESGQELEFQVKNNGPAMDYFMDGQAKPPLAILYWTDDLSVAKVHPLVAGEEPVRDRYPNYAVLLTTSVLGIVLALMLLLVGPLERMLYPLTRR